MGTGGTWGLLSSAGTYAVTTDPNLVHSNFLSFGDHTTGTGNMLVCNGDTTADITVWKQTIPVSPGTDYNFSAWAASVVTTFPLTVAQFQFSVNGVLLGPIFSPSLTPGIWTNFFENWNSGSATSAVIAIVDQTTSEDGNDFALDDIFFRQICSYTDSVTVKGIQYPNVDAGSSQIIFCHTTTATLTGSSTTAAVSYNWAGPEVLSGATSPVATVGAAGRYMFTVTEPANSCQSRDSVTVTKHTLPVISFVADTTQGCYPTLISFISSTDQPGGIYSWSFGDGTVSSDTSSAANPTYSYADAGSYTVSLKYTTTGDCISDTVADTLITIHPHPVAMFDETPKPVSISEPTVSFLDQSTGLISKWSWDFGPYGTSNEQYPQVIYNNIGFYNVQLITTNIYGCKDSVTHPLEVTSIYSLYLPNAFTPNGDSDNDVFRAYGSGMDPDKFEMTIFDRFGEQLFDTKDIYVGWNGTKNNTGIVSQSGVYVYKVVLTDFTGSEHKYMGHVTIVR